MEAVIRAMMMLLVLLHTVSVMMAAPQRGAVGAGLEWPGNAQQNPEIGEYESVYE